jgi:hypothetical protein
MVALVEAGATRPCYLHSSHSGQHLFILRGVIVNAEGRPLTQRFTQDESRDPEATAQG